MELLNFIHTHEDWKELIQQKPYCITVKEDEKYILLSYSQIDSDFSLKIVQQCRGIILRKSDLKIVCYPFDKFFNVQETNASFINWNTAKVQEKLDGSIIKLWYDNEEWHVSTNGTINAENAELQNSLGTAKNYFELFTSAENFYEVSRIKLDENKTYVFELTSPWNRIVVPYTKTEIWHIGTRDNNTFEELNEDTGIRRPRQYNLYSVTQCLMAVQDLPCSQEGYVVVDGHFNRIKIKSPAYVVAHHLRGEGTLNNKRIVEMIKENGQDDFLSIYPEYREAFQGIEQKIINFVVRNLDEWDDNFKDKVFESRKDFAIIANKLTCPAVMYSIQDKKVRTVSEWLFNQTTEKILKWIGVE